MKNIFYCFFLLSLITGCIDKIELKEANVPRKLIVDGTVTNLPGPYFVTLSYSEPFNSTKITELVSGATVTVSDNLGNIYPLSAFTNGVYKTDSASFRGVVGRSYSVNIKTLDGKQYKSRPESILPPVPIDSITSRFVPGQIRTASFEVSVKVKDPSVSGNFYRWKWRNYDTIDICRITRTKNDGGSFVFLAPCCQKCWQITTCYGCLALFSDDLTNGKTFTQKVANIPFDNSYDYYMQIDQYSISKENYARFLSVYSFGIVSKENDIDLSARRDVISRKGTTSPRCAHWSRTVLRWEWISRRPSTWNSHWVRRSRWRRN